MGEPRPGQRPGRRVPLTEAAEILGINRDAVRMRVRRGSLASEKGEDGRVYVFLDPDQDTAHPEAEDQGFSSPLIEALRDEISHLRRESERKDAIIMSLSQSNAELSRTIRAIEAPREAPESPQEGQEEGSPTSGTHSPHSGTEGHPERRNWWRRFWEG